MARKKAGTITSKQEGMQEMWNKVDGKHLIHIYLNNGY